MRPLNSCTEAKLALPITRLSSIRPATATAMCAASSSSCVFASCFSCNAPASASRRKSFGYAWPCWRNACNLARRSATIWFSSGGTVVGWIGWFGLLTSYPLLQARRNEVVEIAVEYGLRVADFVVGAQILDARLVEDVAANLVPPADIGLGVFEFLLLGLALAQLEFVQARLEHRHCLGAIAVLRPVVLALHHDVGRQVRDAHRRVGLVDVLAARAGRPESVDAQIGGVDLDFDGVVDFGVHEHAREGGVSSRVRVEGALAHQPVDAGLGAQVTVGVIPGHLDAGALESGDLAF